MNSLSQYDPRVTERPSPKRLTEEADGPSVMDKAVAQLTYERECLSKTLGNLSSRLDSVLLPGGGNKGQSGSDTPQPSESALLRKINSEAGALGNLNAAVADMIHRLQL